MDAEDKTLTLFTTRMRQMILQYKETVQENKRLAEMLDEKDKRWNNCKKAWFRRSVITTA